MKFYNILFQESHRGKQLMYIKNLRYYYRLVMFNLSIVKEYKFIL